MFYQKIECDSGSQGDSRERRFADIKRVVNSELETEELITGATYIIVMDINFELLYF